jgi:hypothetical protein
MVKPAHFQLNSDFATLKNDDSAPATVVIPASQSIGGSVSAAGTSLDLSTDVTVGSAGAITRTQIASSKDSNKYRASRIVSFTRTGTVSGFSTPYSVVVFAYRINATTMRCQVHILNPYSSTLTTASGSETISFDIQTFLPPFA